MRSPALVALLPLLLGITGVAPCAAQPQSPQGASTVEGKVVHEPGGEPIRKALVRLIGAGSGAAGRALAEMGDTPEAQQVSAEAVDFIVSFAGDTGDASQVYSAATDAEGHFRIEKVPPGKYYVLISRDGYVPVQAKASQSIITVTDGQNVSGSTFKMSTAGLITGKIVDADGDPIAGATVQAISKNEPNSPLNSGIGSLAATFGGSRALPGFGSTNDLGEFRITGLRPGQYLLIARPGGDSVPAPDPETKSGAAEHLVYAATYYPGVLDEKQATPLQVSTGPLSAIDFALQVHRVHRVSGTVSGMGNSKGQIILISDSGRPLQQPLQEGGKFEFPSLEPGKYLVEVIAIPEPGQGGGARRLSLPAPIVVTSSDLTDLVLQALPHATVSGKCHADGQDAVDWKQMSIMLMPISDSGDVSGEKDFFGLSRRTGSGPLHDDGTFDIPDVAPGKYQLAILSSSEKYRDWYLKSLLFSGQEVADTGFSINGDSSLDILVSPKGASIAGTLVDSEGKPVPNIWVTTVPSTGKLARPDAYQTAKTDSDGKFVMRGMNPGDFVVVAVRGPVQDTRASDFYQRYASKGANVSLAEADQKTVTLTLGSDTDQP